MMLRQLLKYRGLGINLLAGFCFIMLVVYGWDLTWEELAGYLLLLFICLAGLVFVAAGLGSLLRRYMSKNKNKKTKGS